MKSLLTALQEGRLIELPDSDKQKSLEYLATIIEAIPDIGDIDGITEGVLAREQLHNTGIGKGWACPHARTSMHGELLSSVGWSPKGIDYGSPDGKPVHLIVMYYVPDAQKNGYLKEISSLAKAIQTIPSMQDLSSLEELGDVRHTLLDAISVAMESMAPDARARMIQLDVKHAAAQETAQPPVSDDIAHRVLSVQIVTAPGAKVLVLAQDADVVQALEGHPELMNGLNQNGRADCKGFHVVLRSVAHFQAGRAVHDCIAMRMGKL